MEPEHEDQEQATLLRNAIRPLVKEIFATTQTQIEEALMPLQERIQELEARVSRIEAGETSGDVKS